MLRLLLVAVAAAAAVSGMQISDPGMAAEMVMGKGKMAPAVDPAGLMGPGKRLAAGTVSVSTAATDPAELVSGGDESDAAVGLDPELTNTLGETFHVTEPGTWNLIGMPKTFDTASPETADLVIDASIEDVGTAACDDLLLRKVYIKGKKLGTNITMLCLSVETDVFNDTNAIGLSLSTPTESNTMYDVTTFVEKFPGCTITRPRNTIAPPTKKSWRKRTKLFTATCSLDGGNNVVTVHWSTVYRGWDRTTATAIYKNDLEVYVSGVGTDPAGLLGPDDHSHAAKAVPGCPKKQPVR